MSVKILQEKYEIVIILNGKKNYEHKNSFKVAKKKKKTIHRHKVREGGF